METLTKIWTTLGAAWSYVDTFVEDHPRYSIAAFVALEVLTIFVMWG